MANQEPIDGIKSEKSPDTTQQLYNSLIQQGYNPNEFNEAIRPTKSIRNSSTDTMKKPLNMLPFILIGIIVFVGLAGGGIFFFAFQKDKADSEIIYRTVNEADDLADEEGNKVGEINTEIGAEMEVTSDCGGMDCFEQKFSECKPATVTSKLMDNIIYYYEIIGLNDGFCEVKSKFTANPNPEWVGKEMTCKYDNTKNFEAAVQDMSKCQGQLYTLMTGG